VDMHVHTVYSADSRIELKALLKYAKRNCMGAGIADHNAIMGALKAVKEAREMGVLVIPGIEVSTKQGHVLAYNVDVQIPSGMSAEETVERIRAVGGVAVIPHPFRMVSGIGSAVHSVPCDAIEVQNSRNSYRANRNALAVAMARKKGFSAGSDAHGIDEVGTSYVEVEAESIDEVLDAIVKGRARVVGSSRRTSEMLTQYWTMLKGYARRGFRKL